MKHCHRSLSMINDHIAKLVTDLRVAHCWAPMTPLFSFQIIRNNNQSIFIHYVIIFDWLCTDPMMQARQMYL